MDAALLSGIRTFVHQRRFSKFKKVMVIGCGGTGAYVAASLARFLKGIDESSRAVMVLADGDIVEEKNLERQHFIAQDLGRNKAEVLADRYSAAFGLNMVTISKEIRSADQISGVLGSDGVVVGCVDNNASRKVISEWFLDNPHSSRWNDSGKFWIDSGNEERGGQVVCGYYPIDVVCGYYPIDMDYLDSSSFSMPTVLELYPDLNEDEAKFNSDAGCAENAESAPQNMMTNVTAATIVMNFLQKVLLKEDMMSHGVVFNIDNSFRTLFNTKDNLAKVDPERLRSWEKGKQ